MKKSLLLLGLCITLFSCTQTEENVHTYWVNSYQVACDGVGKMNCLLVQKAETTDPGNWTNFYSKIDGFDYEPGFIYKLKVREVPVENPPTDASSIKYELVKVLEKKEDLDLNINDIWVANIINGDLIEGDNAPNIEIQLGARQVSGRDGCNRFTGSIQLFGDGAIEFGPIASTRMMCPDMAVADQFNTALAQVKKYRLENGSLTLLDENGKELMTLKKTD